MSGVQEGGWWVLASLTNTASTCTRPDVDRGGRYDKLLKLIDVENSRLTTWRRSERKQRKNCQNRRMDKMETVSGRDDGEWFVSVQRTQGCGLTARYDEEDKRAESRTTIAFSGKVFKKDEK